MAKMKDAIEKRFRDTVAAVEKLRARGGKVVFVRLPVSGGLKALEEQNDSTNQTWDPLLQGYGGSRNLLRRFSRARRFQLPRMVALVRR